MKKIIYKTSVLASLIIMLISFSSCNKYEEGPAISLRSRTERLSNIWKVENYKVNDKDFTSLVSDYTETFSKQKAYNYSWGIFNGSGTWAFQNDDKEVKLSGDDDQSKRVLTILKLEEKNLWYTYTLNGDKHELHLISK